MQLAIGNNYCRLLIALCPSSFAHCLLAIAFCLLLIFSSCFGFNSNKLIIGSSAPEISLPDADGHLLRLSSLKGKIVLVNFWASWCKPCREENPELVALYTKYKDVAFSNTAGFTVFSVSLDTDKGQWQNAISKDNLSWEHNISDLKGWKSPPAENYSVSSIPSSFLIDQHGIIIGMDLKPEELDKTLASMVADNKI